MHAVRLLILRTGDGPVDIETLATHDLVLAQEGAHFSVVKNRYGLSGGHVPIEAITSLFAACGAEFMVAY